MDPVPLDDASGIGSVSMDNHGSWMTMIRMSKSERKMRRLKIYIGKVSPSKVSLKWDYFILLTINLF